MKFGLSCDIKFKKDQVSLKNVLFCQRSKCFFYSSFCFYDSSLEFRTQLRVL